MVQEDTRLGLPQQEPADALAVEPFPPPPSVMLEPDPRPYWSRGPGIGAILAILVAVIGVAILVFLLVARGNQTAQTTPLAPIPTSAAVQPSAAPAPALAPPAPQAPPPQAAAPQVAAPPAPPAGAVAPAPVAPAPALAPPAAAAAAPAAPPAVAAATAADTPAGTILVPGETWRQNGLELTLSSPQLSSNGLTANFSLTNRGQNDARFQFTKGSAFKATDNRGAPSTIGDPNYRYDFVLQPNATMLLDGSHAGGAISFTGPVSSSQASSITVTANGVGGITNAQWRIPVQR